MRKAKTSDLAKIDEIYVNSSIYEVKIQFPKKPLASIKADLDKHKSERLKGFRKGINSGSAILLVALDKKEIIGFGEAIISKDDNSKAEATKIYINKAFRGKGAGSMLMKSLLGWLKGKKVSSVSAGIFAKNFASIGLAKKFGFEITAVKMQKTLKSSK
ncbi:MAG: GNAT family N-acetyltransferase [Nanoarchaeota archaeon]|nr:GNAT family N-acetyltransferase [Nanoarchaeota archaeon]